MSKQTINNFGGISANLNQFNEGRKNLAVKRNPRYIYTDEDPGRSLPDTGFVASYFRGPQDKKHAKPWTNMLRTKW